MYIRILRTLFFLLIVHPIALIVIGLNVRRREKLPQQGPAVVVSNHNSHLDALVLMTVFGCRRLRILRPVAAADYFLSNRCLAWFSTHIIGIIPLTRHSTDSRSDPLQPISDALTAGHIVILFPEGTRGEPEKMDQFRTGVAHLARRHSEVPFVPVFMYGLGKALPRGEGLLVPFFCDVFVGEPWLWSGNRTTFMNIAIQRMDSLAAECHRPDWD